MKINFKSAAIGFAVGLAVTAAGAQAAVQATQHEHPTPSAQKPAADAMKGMEGMKDMDVMMADPAMRKRMVEHMGQCRDMMSKMMQHMGHGAGIEKLAPPQPKH